MCICRKAAEDTSIVQAVLHLTVKIPSHDLSVGDSMQQLAIQEYSLVSSAVELEGVGRFLSNHLLLDILQFQNQTLVLR